MEWFQIMLIHRCFIGGIPNNESDPPNNIKIRDNLIISYLKVGVIIRVQFCVLVC